MPPLEIQPLVWFCAFCRTEVLPRAITVLNHGEIRWAGLGAHSERHDSDAKDQV